MKNYVVVGASSGIGKAISKELIENGGKVHSFSRSESIEQEVEAHTRWDAIEDDFPGDALPDEIHGLVYCPGSINLRSFRSMKPEDFRAELEVNLIGAIKAIKAATKGLTAVDESYILMFSTVAVGTGMPFHASIASAKGAVEGLVRSLAAEMAPKVRVNAIAPSLVETPLAEKLLSSEDKRKISIDRHPLKMIGNPEMIAAMGVKLLDGTFSWMTGQIVSMDGGISSIRK